MNTYIPPSAAAWSSQRPHIVFGGGIVRALIGNLGVLMAARKCGVDFASTGGISAGSVMPLLYAAGVPTEELRNVIMSHNMSDFLQHNYSRMHIARLIWRVLNRRKYRTSLPSKGLYNTDKLADFIAGYVTEWPENYWTLAYAPREKAQVIFTKMGVHMRQRDGTIRLLDDKPADIGLAIRATCAVPGFFDSVVYTSSSGQTVELFDGYLSWDGYCPAPFVEKFFGAAKQAIIACDVIKYKTPNRLLNKGYLAVLTPDLPFPAHRFSPSSLEKEKGMTTAFNEAETVFASLQPSGV